MVGKKLPKNNSVGAVSYHILVVFEIVLDHKYDCDVFMVTISCE